MSILDEDIGCKPITKNDLIKFGFNIHRPISELFGEWKIGHLIKRIYVDLEDNMFHSTTVQNNLQPLQIIVRIRVELSRDSNKVKTTLTPLVSTNTHCREWYHDGEIIIEDTDLSTLASVISDEYIKEKFKYFQVL